MSEAMSFSIKHILPHGHQHTFGTKGLSKGKYVREILYADSGPCFVVLRNVVEVENNGQRIRTESL